MSNIPGYDAWKTRSDLDELDELLKDDIDIEPEPECIGSCDECQVNVYADEFCVCGGLVLCNHCAWSYNATRGFIH